MTTQTTIDAPAVVGRRVLSVYGPDQSRRGTITTYDAHRFGVTLWIHWDGESDPVKALLLSQLSTGEILSIGCYLVDLTDCSDFP
jgi:hypothetical protein